ncbi:MAG: hypothetical protein MJ202_01665 [Lentisphaeria bacterium]|nr:hypothetical protein [Lentisphaeria bacterium]
MKFNHVGKAYQLVIKNGQDLQDALTLDEALWVAMSAPLKAYTCDQKVLEYIDTPKLGSITTESLKRAIKWLLDVYPNKEAITDHFNGKLTLSDLNAENADAKAISHSASYILKDLNAEDQTAITLAQVHEFQKILTSRPLNGDGVISIKATAEAAAPEIRKDLSDFVADAAKATGGTTDLDGTQGVTLDQFKTFLNAIPGYLAWHKAGLLPEGQASSELYPFGGDTAANLALLKENADLVDKFFALRDLQDFDARLAGQVLENDGKPGTLDPTAWPGVESHLKTMPIVQPAGKAAIRLDNLEFINPLYRAWWNALTDKVLLPILGADTKELTPAAWAKVKGVFGAYEAYMASEQGGICAAIDLAHLEHYVTLKGLMEAAQDLADKDLAVADILREAGTVEKALLYLKWIVKLANNFISFPDLYTPETATLFERGRLVIDGRWFNLTFPVDDMGAHSAQAANSGLFLIYVEVNTAPAQILCAPVTIGDKGNLVVGKRGIFFAPDGLTYNAKILKVMENPVCLKEAVLAPFSKFGKMAEDKVASMSNASETVINGKMATVINDPKAVAAGAAAVKPVEPKSDKSNMLMGLGIAFAALSSAFAFICKTIAGLSGLAILISLLCILFVVIGPIVLLAILRLRRQDLSSLLEGNGWAINSRMRLSRKQRATFSRNGRFPEGAQGTPFRRAMCIMGGCILAVVLIAAGIVGYFWLTCDCDKKCDTPAEVVVEQVAETAETTVAAVETTEAPAAN